MSQAEVKHKGMQVNVADYAKKHGVSEGVILGVLSDLGVAVDGGQFEADDDTLALLDEEVSQHSGDAALTLEPGITLRDLASAMGKEDKEVLKFCMVQLKKPMTLTTKPDDATVEKIAQGFGFQVRWRKGEAPKKAAAPKPSAPVSGAIKRPPVVTILGHVDHGKTSLLDYIRKANVAAKEFGGITQHIGAYQVKIDEGVITFLDTPGHAAFTAMRARGAQVTDIAVLVVAADDGIMPQTIEAINHAKNAGVPIIVAVNKIDKPDANPDRVLTQLTEHELVAEEYGGDVIVRKVSAHTGEGVDELLEMIVLQADLMDLKADPKGELKGVVIEAKLEKGRGPVATVLVQNGTLRVGDVLVCGYTHGKVRAMTDYRGERLKEAGPSMPVEILGLDEVPGAGDQVERVADEREGREMAHQRQEEKRLREISGPKRRISLRDIRKLADSQDIKDLNIIVKADVQGSVEAVRGLIDKLEHPEVNIQVIHSGVGAITESDIILASAANAIVVGFNTRPEAKAKSEAERQKVEIRVYTIIYELIEDIEAAIKGMLEPKYEERYLGTVEVRAVFKLTKAGKVAGCHVTDGRIFRGSKVRVRRGTEEVYSGEIASLRNVKQDVREMAAGQDCGIKFAGWEDFAEGDVIEAYEMVLVNE